MPRGLIAFIVIAFAAIVILFMNKSADKARLKSDKILEKFKTIDKDLQQTTIVIDSANKILPDSLSGKNN
jgi:hypothetical protein